MSPTLHPSRRRCLQAALSALGGVACARALAQATPAVDALPVARSLAHELARALTRHEPLLVMVSLPGCAFCHEARQNYLLPLQREGLPVVQVDMRSSRSITDLSGSETTHDGLVRQWAVRLAPTVLFFGAGGREVADRMKGAYVPDFYGGYLDQRIATARARIRATSG